jgi:hypothetical protein
MSYSWPENCTQDFAREMLITCCCRLQLQAVPLVCCHFGTTEESGRCRPRRRTHWKLIAQTLHDGKRATSSSTSTAICPLASPLPQGDHPVDYEAVFFLRAWNLLALSSHMELAGQHLASQAALAKLTWDEKHHSAGPGACSDTDRYSCDALYYCGCGHVCMRKV